MNSWPSVTAGSGPGWTPARCSRENAPERQECIHTGAGEGCQLRGSLGDAAGSAGVTRALAVVPLGARPRFGRGGQPAAASYPVRFLASAPLQSTRCWPQPPRPPLRGGCPGLAYPGHAPHLYHCCRGGGAINPCPNGIDGQLAGGMPRPRPDESEGERKPNARRLGGRCRVGLPHAWLGR